MDMRGFQQYKEQSVNTMTQGELLLLLFKESAFHLAARPQPWCAGVRVPVLSAARARQPRLPRGAASRPRLSPASAEAGTTARA